MPVPVHPAPPASAAISCIICAFNEAPRIAEVLAIASVHPLLAEVIVVDDGSTDLTAETVRGFPSVRLVCLPHNRGKSAAMAAGVALAKNDLVMLLDADLKGLSAADLTALADPVLSDRTDLSLSLRQNSLWLFRMMGLDFVTGERLVRRELLSELLVPMNALPGFAIEVFMNRQIISRKLSLAVVNWPGVSQSRKTEKMGYARGTWAEFRMVAELLRTASPFTLLSQSISLLFLRDRCSARMGESFALDQSPPGPQTGQGKLAQRAHARMKASIVSMWAARRAGK